MTLAEALARATPQQVLRVDDVEEAAALYVATARRSRTLRALDPLQTGETQRELCDERVLEEHPRELRSLRRGDVRRWIVISNVGTLRCSRMTQLQQDSTRAGERTRAVARVPKRLALLDDVAVLGLADGQPGAYFVHDQGLRRVLEDVFQTCWDAAREWRPDAVDQDPDVRTRVIDLLGQGLVDEAIARRLEVSPRTVARVIAALMREHDCQTRFQLGMAIARS